MLKIFFVFCWLNQVIITGRVDEVLDGDTFILKTTKHTYTVRVAHVDAPEREQRKGKEATQFAKTHLLNKTVTILNITTDKYGRIVGDVLCDGKRFSKEIVESGLAWHYKKYSNDAEIAHAEQIARKQKRGLWADTNAISPDDFRRKWRGKTDTLKVRNREMIDSLFERKRFLGKIVR